jgi:hypothetical protein
MSKKALRALLVVTLAAASPALAQGGPGPCDGGPCGGGPGPGRWQGGRMYDPSTVTTVSGTVEQVEKIARKNHHGVHLTLATSAGPLSVHLGPDFYLEKQAVKIGQGDRIDVTGSKVTLQGKPALIAQSVKKGDAVLTLRDAAGVPAWAGQGKPSK